MCYTVILADAVRLPCSREPPTALLACRQSVNELLWPDALQSRYIPKQIHDLEQCLVHMSESAH